MTTATRPAAPVQAKFRPEDAMSTRRRHRALAGEPPAGVPVWTPDDGDPS